mmetsp:Transcript_10186/g.41247  ORF Transcript_10186/g.41247 Transcript_10186/m.41247 type:complete len:242 (-) Transcript_10186:180-905(-)
MSSPFYHGALPSPSRRRRRKCSTLYPRYFSSAYSWTSMARSRSRSRSSRSVCSRRGDRRLLVKTYTVGWSAEDALARQCTSNDQRHRASFKTPPATTRSHVASLSSSPPRRMRWCEHTTSTPPGTTQRATCDATSAAASWPARDESSASSVPLSTTTSNEEATSHAVRASPQRNSMRRDLGVALWAASMAARLTSTPTSRPAEKPSRRISARSVDVPQPTSRTRAVVLSRTTRRNSGFRAS